jgi:hypothetical protein
MMARTRLLKPGFFTNDDLAELPMAARLLFAGLWTLADRAGRLSDRPRRIKAEILPYDDEDVDALLNGLAERGFIVRYGDAEHRYVAIVNFAKHQSPHVREPVSVIPPPDEHDACIVPAPDEHDASPSSRARLPYPSPDTDTDTDTGSITKTHAPAQKAPKAAVRDVVNAVTRALEYDNTARLSQKEFDRLLESAAQIVGAGGVPEDVPIRADRYRRKYPGIPITHSGLAGRWRRNHLRGPVRRGGRPL